MLQKEIFEMVILLLNQNLTRKLQNGQTKNKLD